MPRIYVLGAGTPTPTADRFGSSYVLELDGQYLMFDCGPAATHKLVQAGLYPTQISHLFFTHHHFDHDVDYPCFLLTRWDQSGDQIPDLEVIGPPLTKTFHYRLMDGAVGAFAHDWTARVNSASSQHLHVRRGGSLPRRPPTVNIREMLPEEIYDGPGWSVRAALAEHAQPWLDSLAYRIDWPSGSVVVTGDTRPCQSVLDLAQSADTMLCCCWDDQNRMLERGERGMCGTVQAAEMAQSANVKRLVLVHVGPDLSRHPDREKAIADIRRVYEGEVIFPDELMSFEV